MKTFLLLFFAITLNASISPETLYDGNCITCHEMNKTVSAPSTKELVRVYKKRFVDKDEFVNFMVEWVSVPDEKSALMKDAIKRHGLMPLIPYDKEALKKIAEYLFELE